MRAWQQVLVAALTLEERGESPFTASALVVEAWRQFPDKFGIDGMPEHPSDNRVICQLSGHRGLVACGYLERTAPKTYRLLPDGREAAQHALGREIKPEVASESPERNGRLSKAVESDLERMLDSMAVQFHKLGERSSIKFEEACKFWDLRATGDNVDKRLSRATEVLERVTDDHVLSNGRCVSLTEVEAAHKAHDWMGARWAARLESMKKQIQNQAN